MDLGAVFRETVRQPLDIEDGVEGIAAYLGIFKGAQCLFAEGGSVDQKQDAVEALRLDQAEHQGNSGPGFARPGRHRQQDILLTGDDGLLNGLYRLFLVVAQPQFAHITVTGKPEVVALGVLRQHGQQLFGAMPLGQGSGHIAGMTHIPIPDAALALHGGAIFATIGGEAEWHLVAHRAAGFMPLAQVTGMHLGDLLMGLRVGG